MGKSWWCLQFSFFSHLACVLGLQGTFSQSIGIFIPGTAGRVVYGFEQSIVTSLQCLYHRSSIDVLFIESCLYFLFLVDYPQSKPWIGSNQHARTVVLKQGIVINP